MLISLIFGRLVRCYAIFFVHGVLLGVHKHFEFCGGIAVAFNQAVVGVVVLLAVPFNFLSLILE